MKSNERDNQNGDAARFENAANESAAIDALNELAWEIRGSETERAMGLSEKARTFSEKISYKKGLAYSLRNSGFCHWSLCDYERAQAELKEALRLFQEIGDEFGEASALNWLGNTYWRKSDFQSALTSHLDYLQLRRKIADAQGEADSLNNLGLVYFDLGDYAKALEFQLAGLKLNEERNSLRGLAFSYNNTAIVYERIGDYEKALELNLRSLQIKRETGNRIAEPGSLTNIGVIYEHLEEYKRALECQRESLKVAEETGNSHAVAIALTNMGNVYFKLTDYKAARAHHERSMKILKELGDKYCAAESLIGMCNALIELGDTSAALIHLQQALAVADEVKANDLIYKAHEKLSSIYETTGDFAGALAHFKEFYLAKELVFSEESKMRLQQLNIQTEVEKTQREAEIHRLKNVELANAYRELQNANKQKDELLEKLKHQAEILERQTMEDSLTGIYNRRYLDSRLFEEFRRCLRFKHELTIVLADIDKFKAINDGFSHQVGDEVIKTVARVLHDNCRAIDIVGRYGGEEFLLILPETSLKNAVAHCEKLRKLIQEYDWQSIAKDLSVTVSMGLADDLTVANHEKLLSLADEKLYDAKRSGRNCVCC